MLEGSAKDSEKTMYPFRIKHLGKEVYTLFAPSASNRQDWCDKIILAKTKHAAALFAQNAEPFKLRVIADSAFAYETVSGGSKGITIKNTPLDRAVQEVE
ncbi:Rho guanine nucleotide exchange factor, partial [Cryomyces antarcticus]